MTLDAGWSGHGAFEEAGADALDLRGRSESWRRLDGGIGMALSYSMPGESGGKLLLEGRALWEHAFADILPTQALALAGSPAAFTIRGPQTGRERLRIGAGLAWDVANGTTLRARYDALLAGRQSSHNASLALSFAF